MGNDLFMLKRNGGKDMIADFALDQDLIGRSGISFSELSIVSNITNNGTGSTIMAGGSILAEVIGILANQLSIVNFVLI